MGAVPELMQLVAHTCTARVVLQRWREGDLAARSRVSYPDGLLAWAQKTFLRSKRQQAALLGTAGGRAGEAVKRVAGVGGGGGGGAGGGEEVTTPLLAAPARPGGPLRSRL